MSSDSAAVSVARPHIEAHDLHHQAEPDLVDKGLEHNALGLVASVALAISCVAPAYALTATLGRTVTEVGVQMPATFLLLGVVVMLVWQARAPAFFRGETLQKDTPALVVEE